MRGFTHTECRIILIGIVLVNQFLSDDINPCVQILNLQGATGIPRAR